MLEQCLAAGLFLSRGDAAANGQWYRWHAVRRSPSDVWPPSTRTAAWLHASAATWWTPVDAPTAIGHALAAGDGERASKIFSERWSSSSSRGASTRCSTWSSDSPTYRHTAATRIWPRH